MQAALALGSSVLNCCLAPARSYVMKGFKGKKTNTYFEIHVQGVPSALCPEVAGSSSR